METQPRPVPGAAVSAAMLADPDFQMAHLEFLALSQHVKWAGGDGIDQRAASAVAGGDDGSGHGRIRGG